MNHIPDITQLVVAIGICINSMVAAAAWIQSYRNGKKSTEIAAHVAVIQKQTDGINKQLVEVTGKAALAEGKAIGLEQGRAENPAVPLA
jgi:hypothetical protein